MCRFLAYSGKPVCLHDLLYGPEHSIIRQSHGSREQPQPLNADGFGIGWYIPELSPFPGVFRSIQPAWSSENLESISRLTRSGHIFAHVRAASPGSAIAELNCHPFRVDRFLWMHNGTVAGYVEFREWARRRLSRKAFSRLRGSTDSELLFALFLDLWEETGASREPLDLAEALRKTLQLITESLEGLGVHEPSNLNIAVTDGQTMVASRYSSIAGAKPASLYLAGRICVVSEEGSVTFEEDESSKSVVVASEPLSRDPVWREVPAGHIVVVPPSGDFEWTPAGRGTPAVSARDGPGTL